MRLEALFDMDLRYRGDSVWLSPYGDREWAGYGEGDGTVAGERIRGTVRWANHPRRREDGVWCPDLHGFIASDDGARILLTIQGYSIRQEGEHVKRTIVAWATFRAQDSRYRWLNLVVGILEGEIDEETEAIRFKGYACVNELASAPSAIRYPSP